MDNGSAVRESFRRVTPYALTVLGVAGACWLEVLLRGSDASPLSLTPLGLAIALSVWLGGLVTGLIALFLSALAADLLVIEPGSLLSFRNSGSAIAYAGFL